MTLEITRRTALAGALVAASGAATGAVSDGGSGQRTFLVCHGAWSAGWCWRKMRAFWHRPPHSILFTPTMTGVGERAHLATPAIDLDVHIRDILAVIEMEDLHDVILVAHSYGGIVGTGVADRAPGRIRQIIYVDAFVPVDGESLYDILGQPLPPAGVWLVPPRPVPPDTSAADKRWIAPRRTAQPLATFTTPVRLKNPSAMPPRSYVRCTRVAPDDPLLSSARRAQVNGWPYREIDCSHSPHITAPERLAAVVEQLVRPA